MHCCTSLVAVDGPGNDEDIPNMRLGPDDVNIDTIEVHSLWDAVGVEVSNVGEHSYTDYPASQPSRRTRRRGTVDWESIVSSLPSAELQEMVINPGISWQTEVSTPSVFDTHLILVKPAFDGEYSEVRVTMHYVDDELIWSAMLLSFPSLPDCRPSAGAGNRLRGRSGRTGRR
ncbi:MAG: hypothetical protein Ct9H300mP10_03830 [Methanobacteriota archaeon]|nr:MAG: hypothetical protein Ct9H300mP10_03830 [Euryarchaeota archaeon]